MSERCGGGINPSRGGLGPHQRCVKQISSAERVHPPLRAEAAAEVPGVVEAAGSLFLCSGFAWLVAFAGRGAAMGPPEKVQCTLLLHSFLVPVHAQHARRLRPF